MMKIFKSLIVGLLIFSFVLVALSQINLVEAQEIIYIRTDGSVEGTNKIQQNNNLYTLTGSITGSIVIEKDDVVLDGANFTLQGSGRIDRIFEYEKGISVHFRNNVTIKNVKLSGYRYCVFFENTTNSKIVHNEIISDLWENGINIANSTDVLISNNNLIHIANPYSSQSIGIFLQYSNNNTMSLNNLNGGWWRGILLGVDSENNFVYSSNIVGVQIGIEINSERNQIYENNLSSTVSLHGVPNNGIGIKFSRSLGGNNNLIFKNNVTNNKVAISFEGVSNNTFFLNNFINSSQKHADARLEFSNYNSWDNGTIGNFWDNFGGVDSNDDGIGDTPHVIDEKNQDNYPSMNIIPEFLSWIILPILLIGSLFIMIFKKKILLTDHKNCK